MGSKFVCLCMTFLTLTIFVGFGSSSTFAEDRTACADKLVALATCLSYVGGNAKSPTPDCCAGLKMVVEKSPRCLCVLIKDRNDPTLGLKVNATLALNLPSACRVPLNVSTCIDLLHLAPNSTDAKVFADFEKSLDAKNGSTPITGTSGSSQAEANKNNGWKGKRCQGFEIIVFGTLLWIFTSHLVVVYV